MSVAATRTAGPWDYFVGNANGRGLIRVEAAISSDDAGEHICSFPRGPKGEAHAALVSETGTVTHETGLTPRQLAEQRAELLTACKAAEKWLSGWASAEPYLTTIRAVIAKTEGRTP